MNEVKELMNKVWHTQKSMLLLMRAKGYEIKGESIVTASGSIEESDAKYISFRPLDKERFVRGSTKSLGKEYTKERIRERIEMKRERKSAKQSVVKLEHHIKDLAEIIKYVEQYKNNRSYHIAYKKSKNPDAYFRRYESQLILYGGARRVLEQTGINLKGLNVDKLKAEYQELMKQKNELTSTYKKFEKEVQSLTRKLENLNQYIGQT